MEESIAWYRSTWAKVLLIVAVLMGLGCVLFVRQIYVFYTQLKQGGHPILASGRGYSGVEKATSTVSEADRLSMKLKVAGQPGEPFAGPATATHEIVEFVDFDCPYCLLAMGTVHDILRLRPDIKVVIRDYPLVDLHPDAETAAKAARCMWRQGVPGMYWRFHDLLFANPDQRDTDTLSQMATQVGADSRFITCLQGTLTEGTIRQSIIDATAAGVTVTPTFFVDGLKIEGAADTETLLNSLAP